MKGASTNIRKLHLRRLDEYLQRPARCPHAADLRRVLNETLLFRREAQREHLRFSACPWNGRATEALTRTINIACPVNTTTTHP